ncbi:immunity 22 family protein [Snodgrassella sp. B3837]|uniref:immunity 22 family protein n=1 Tax=Snodgrassella sp. B3837 TaxID=2818040 RepID=UPI002269A257|nr:immunity 22 family protein [Snodgrassella sp. B3837]MCX8754056.1 immunity 22 family protein [Snodgrassella sp. B3837]
MNKIDINKVTIQLWIGNNFLEEEKYQQYFQQFEGIQKDVLNPKPRCLFCADIGEIAYITEKLVALERFSSSQKIEYIIDSIKVNKNEKKRIYEKCIELGISKANALFWYKASELTLKKPYKENYNGLKYIGIFNI